MRIKRIFLSKNALNNFLFAWYISILWFTDMRSDVRSDVRSIHKTKHIQKSYKKKKIDMNLCKIFKLKEIH
jgi:hypothetical protein